MSQAIAAPAAAAPAAAAGGSSDAPAAEEAPAEEEEEDDGAGFEGLGSLFDDLNRVQSFNKPRITYPQRWGAPSASRSFDR